MENFQIGAGYNPYFLANSATDRLDIPTDVSCIELGMAEFIRWRMNPINDVDLSLHLARTPVSENNTTQDQFISYLYGYLHHEKKLSQPSLCSIGLHLIGPRNQGIGRYGFSTHYEANHDNKKQACRFILQLQHQLRVPIWIENANFYSASAQDILSTWLDIKEICEYTNSKLIVDLSHLFIDCSNNKISPYSILGILPWSHVIEIHLSGVILGKNGVYHDGHASPVPAYIWELFEECLKLYLGEASKCIVTIEHTDPSWQENQDAYYSDFEKLRNTLQRSLQSNECNLNSEQYAKSYLKKLLKQWIPLLPPACGQRNLSFDDVFDHWIKDVLTNKDNRIALSEEEVPPQELKDVHIASEDFLRYAKQKLAVRQ